MRYGKTLLGILILLAMPLLLWVGLARAQEFKSGDNVTVSQGQTVNSMLWAAGKNIDIAGTINGDVFCAGQNVHISATVNGDVICAGQDVRISGPVNGDVRVAGQNVTVSSKISGSLSVAGSSFSLDQTGSVGRDASLAASDAALNGTVSRDVAAAGATLNISSAVGRNVKATAEKVNLSSNAKVGGNLTYTSKNNAAVAQGATVAGSTHRYEPTAHHKKTSFAAFSLLFSLYVFLSLLLIALVAVLLLPRLFVVTTDVAVASPWWTLLVGFLATIIFPLLIIVLLLTVLGIPLALLLLCAWFLIIEVGALSFSFWIGRMIFRGKGNAILIMLVGAILVLLGMMVPILGFFVFFATAWWGIGMVLTALWRHLQRPSYALATVARPTEVASTNTSPTNTRATTRRKNKS